MVEFDHFKSHAGLPGFVLSVSKWRDANPDLKGIILDYAKLNVLICLSKMEKLNSVFVGEKMPQ